MKKLILWFQVKIGYGIGNSMASGYRDKLRRQEEFKQLKWFWQ